jgi:hypothetical protein
MMKFGIEKLPSFLVGGFNPSEKYYTLSHFIGRPQGGIHDPAAHLSTPHRSTCGLNAATSCDVTNCLPAMRRMTASSSFSLVGE